MATPNFFFRKPEISICTLHHTSTIKLHGLYIHCQWKQEYSHYTQPISWLMMKWRRKKPGHQQPCYWPSLVGTFRFQHIKWCISSKEVRRSAPRPGFSVFDGSFHFAARTHCHTFFNISTGDISCEEGVFLRIRANLDIFLKHKMQVSRTRQSCQDYPGYFREPPWLSMGLQEISRVTLSGMQGSRPSCWHPKIFTITHLLNEFFLENSRTREI